jgi:hypothetical protein
MLLHPFQEAAMRPLRPVTVLLAALLALGACAQLTGPASVPGEARAQLQRWESRGLRDYRFTVARTCFCTPEFTAPARVEVRGGRVAQVTDAATGRTRDLREGFTIAELFGWIVRAQEEGTYVEAAYHPEQGYPVRVVIGTLANDAGTAYSISGLEPIR